jgi:hypothetical protein
VRYTIHSAPEAAIVPTDVFSPCLGLHTADNRPGGLAKEVLCENDVQIRGADLGPGGVMDVIITSAADPTEVFGAAADTNDDQHRYVALLRRNDQLYYHESQVFTPPERSADGKWLLEAKFDFYPNMKVDGQVSNQSKTL